MRARALSPDKTVTATMSMVDGMRVAYEPGRIVRHTAETLEVQVKAALTGAMRGYQRACELAARPDTRTASQLSEVERAIREHVARVSAIEVTARSVSGHVRVKWGGDGEIDVRMADEAVRELGPRGLAGEINSAVAAALSQRGTRAAALFEDELGQYIEREEG